MIWWALLVKVVMRNRLLGPGVELPPRNTWLCRCCPRLSPNPDFRDPVGPGTEHPAERTDGRRQRNTPSSAPVAPSPPGKRQPGSARNCDRLSWVRHLVERSPTPANTEAPRCWKEQGPAGSTERCRRRRVRLREGSCASPNPPLGSAPRESEKENPELEFTKEYLNHLYLKRYVFVYKNIICSTFLRI